MPNYSTATVQTSAPYNKGDIYSVHVASANGYTITKVKLYVGTLQTTRSGAGDIAITLRYSGVQAVKIAVEATKSSQIYTEQYSLPDIGVDTTLLQITSYEVLRTDSSGIADDEGTKACIEMTVSYPETGSNYLLEPIVKVDGTQTSNVTWYTSWASATGTFSGAVNWTNYAPESPVTLYGKMTDTFSDSSSYEISLTARTTLENKTRTKTLAQTFRLLSARAGGKGLGIGMKPTTDALWLNMDMEVYQQKDFHFNLDTTVDPNNPDYDLYEVLGNLGLASNLKVILNYLARAASVDYEVSKGTSGIWAYRKWNSGRTELWAKDSVSSLAITTAKGSLYSSAQRQVNLPFTVYDGVGSVSIGSTGTSTYYPWAGNVRVYEGSIRYYAMCTSSVTLNADDISYIVTGRWK